MCLFHATTPVGLFLSHISTTITSFLSNMTYSFQKLKFVSLSVFQLLLQYITLKITMSALIDIFHFALFFLWRNNEHGSFYLGRCADELNFVQIK